MKCPFGPLIASVDPGRIVEWSIPETTPCRFTEISRYPVACGAELIE
jgi:hypothetical protein